MKHRSFYYLEKLIVLYNICIFPPTHFDEMLELFLLGSAAYASTISNKYLTINCWDAFPVS